MRGVAASPGAVHVAVRGPHKLGVLLPKTPKAAFHGDPSLHGPAPRRRAVLMRHSAPLLPTPVWDLLPAAALRVGDARWFTNPPAGPPPLAFYGTVQGRTAYYEVDLQACSKAALQAFLQASTGILALQLPAAAMDDATMALLLERCAGLECLRLPCTTQLAAGQVQQLLERVAGQLRVLALGGRPDVFVSPSLGPVAAPYVRRMDRLEYLDMADGGIQWQPSSRDVRAMLGNKHLRGLSLAGHWRADVAGILEHKSLRQVQCLDLRRCALQGGWFAAPVQRLAHAVQNLSALREVQLPTQSSLEKDAHDQARLRAWLAGRDMAYVHWDGGATQVLHDGAGRAVLQRMAALPPEEALRAWANLDPQFVESGRWFPPPRERWVFMDLHKRGSVYVLRELAALRGLGHTVDLKDFALGEDPSGRGYRMQWSTQQGQTFWVSIDPALLHQALDKVPVATYLARAGTLGSVRWPASTTAEQLRRG